MVNTRQDLDSTHACALLQAKVISIQIFWIVHFEISYIGVLFSVVEGSTSSLVVFVIWLPPGSLLYIVFLVCDKVIFESITRL